MALSVERGDRVVRRNISSQGFTPPPKPSATREPELASKEAQQSPVTFAADRIVRRRTISSSGRTPLAVVHKVSLSEWSTRPSTIEDAADSQTGPRPGSAIARSRSASEALVPVRREDRASSKESVGLLRRDSLVRELSEAEVANREKSAKEFFFVAELSNKNRRTDVDVEKILAAAKRWRAQDVQKAPAAEKPAPAEPAAEAPAAKVSLKTLVRRQSVGVPNMPPGWVNIPGMPPGWNAPSEPTQVTQEWYKLIDVAQVAAKFKKTPTLVELNLKVKLGSDDLRSRLLTQRRNTIC